MTVTGSFELEKAVQAMRERRPQEAIALLQGVLDASPSDFTAGWLMLQCLEMQREREAAACQLDHLANEVAKTPFELDQLAEFAYQHGLAMDAVVGACKRALSEHPDDGNMWFNLAVYLSRDTRSEEAIESYREAIRCGVRSPEQVELNIASIYMDHLQDPERARRHLEAARRINPRHPAVYQNLGTLAEQQGDRELAARAFEKCLELSPANHPILARLADAHRFSDPNDPLLRRLQRTLATTDSADLHFALARAFDQLGDYEAAWRHFSHANRLDAGRFPPYDPERTEKLFDRLCGLRFDELTEPAEANDHAPVFICGLFRSGSTLLEKMLAAHPAFTAGGESEFFPRLMARHLPYYPAGLDAVTIEETAQWRQQHRQWAHRMTGGSSRLLDKRPDNFLIAGLIDAVLPGAKFIVTERDPRDMAVSIYATRLNPRQNYATELANIRHYLEQHRRLVDHWESTLEDRLVRVRYEDLVRQPRATLEPLLDWLGEVWDDDCLAFHAKRGPVRTVSAWQVREPLYRSSIGRWRNYSGSVGKVFGDES
jgi:tetratricopeptide (TPR) repeat protein